MNEGRGAVPRQTKPTTTSASIQWPALLLPLRLETRRIDDDICIRVFPDQPFVDVHQKELTQEEHDAGTPLRDFIMEHGDELARPTIDDTILDQARGEWLELARRYGSGR